MGLTSAVVVLGLAWAGLSVLALVGQSLALLVLAVCVGWLFGTTLGVRVLL